MIDVGFGVMCYVYKLVENLFFEEIFENFCFVISCIYFVVLEYFWDEIGEMVFFF